MKVLTLTPEPRECKGGTRAQQDLDLKPLLYRRMDGPWPLAPFFFVIDETSP